LRLRNLWKLDGHLPDAPEELGFIDVCFVVVECAEGGDELGYDAVNFGGRGGSRRLWSWFFLP
jgi:hypothetical protein